MPDQNLKKIRAMIARRKLNDSIFNVAGFLAMMLAVLTLLALFGDLLWDGFPRLISWEFFTSFPPPAASATGRK